MSDTELEQQIRRILVALDASPHSLAALEAAAELAARLEAELLGLFVEDINLLRSAGLPFAREVGALSSTPQRLDSQRMERELRAQANRARRAMARIAGRTRVRWSFRVTRGQVASEVLAAASEADLISLGKAGWSWPGRGQLGSTARGVFAQARCHALLAQRGIRLAAPVAVVYDGSPSAKRALNTAARLMRGRRDPLIVFLLGNDAEHALQLRNEVQQELQAQEVEARFHDLTGVDLSRLAQVFRSAGAGLVILPAESPRLPGEQLQRLLGEMECALVVR
ncbi:MAG TPA: universal stress protein [Caldilineae bacterium]|jgi:nucleotide-binding universal stress UspA family protein|nr:universal stress protein [Caldilineae bacterium]